MGAYLKSPNALQSSIVNIIWSWKLSSPKSLEIGLFSFQNAEHFSVFYLRDFLYYG